MDIKINLISPVLNQPMTDPMLGALILVVLVMITITFYPAGQRDKALLVGS